MNATAVIALVDTNDLREATENLVLWLIAAVVAVVVGSIIVIRLGGGLIRRAAATTRGRAAIRILLLIVFAVGVVDGLANGAGPDLRSLAVLIVTGAVALSALAVVVRLLGEPAGQMHAEPGPQDQLLQPDDTLPPDPFFR